MTTLTTRAAGTPTSFLDRVAAKLPHASEFVETTGMLAIAGFMLACINHIL